MAESKTTQVDAQIELALAQARLANAQAAHLEQETKQKERAAGMAKLHGDGLPADEN